MVKHENDITVHICHHCRQYQCFRVLIPVIMIVTMLIQRNAKLRRETKFWFQPKFTPVYRQT